MFMAGGSSGILAVVQKISLTPRSLSRESNEWVQLLLESGHAHRVVEQSSLGLMRDLDQFRRDSGLEHIFRMAVIICMACFRDSAVRR